MLFQLTKKDQKPWARPVFDGIFYAIWSIMSAELPIEKVHELFLKQTFLFVCLLQKVKFLRIM